MTAKVTLQWVVPPGYAEGDYARLCGNSGSGDIDWENPLTSQIFELFPEGAGIYGFGHAPFGHFSFGKAHSIRTRGFGHLPFGHHAFGYGANLIEAIVEVTSCGDYKFGFACYDSLDNLHTGTPEEATLTIHIAPAAPTGLTKSSYNKSTDILVLNAA